MNEFELYKNGLSIPEVSEITGIAKSTLRFRLKKAGILRGRADAIRLCSSKGKLGSGNRGKKIIFSDEWKNNISKSKLGKGKGFSIKPDGYAEVTMGEYKGRKVHVMVMEKHIGRRLYINECVHHIDENKLNNDINNLQLMTFASHARHHAKQRNLKKKGR